MGRKASITLHGPATFSEPGKPTMVRGKPLVTSDEAVIKWAESEGFLKVKYLDEPKAKAAPKAETKAEPEPKAEPAKPAPAKPAPAKPAPKPKPKPKPKPQPKGKGKGSGTKSAPKRKKS